MSDNRADSSVGSTTSTSSDSETYYQRTFYRLSASSPVAVKHALLLEERLRFRKKTSSDGAMDETSLLPDGPRTLILRQGTTDDEITDEMFRMDVVGSAGKQQNRHHNGPRTFDTAIASILFMASNPQFVQGNVLELSSTSSASGSQNGVVGVLGCIAAQCALLSTDPSEDDELKTFVKHVQTIQQGRTDVAKNIMTVPSTALSGGDDSPNIFPKRLHRLTLSDESLEVLQPIQDFLQSQKAWVSPSKVSVQPVQWNARNRPTRQQNVQYRTILGTDLDINFPTAKELARFVAHSLLPSNEFAVANLKGGAETAPSFGALGMDPEPSSTSHKEDVTREVDPAIPPTFCHVTPDRSGGGDDELAYLRQFLEKGYRMTVDLEYVRMERLQFVLQKADNDAALDAMEDLELQEESHRDYQTLTAFHHPDYAGEGGEYFFPIETGAYEGGIGRGRGDGNPYLDTEFESNKY